VTCERFDSIPLFTLREVIEKGGRDLKGWRLFHLVELVLFLQSELAALEFLAASLRSSTKLQEDLRSWQIPALLQPLARIHQHPYFRHHSVSSAWPWAAIERRCQATAADMSAQVQPDPFVFLLQEYLTSFFFFGWPCHPNNICN
jgi:hypothetical protein